MTIFNNITKFWLISSLLASSAYANSHSYYQNEGELLFKMKGFYTHLDTKPKFDSNITNTGNPGDVISVAYGAEGSVSYFFNANFATELSAGIGYMNIKKSEINKVATAIGGSLAGAMDNKDMLMLPFGVLVQYHVAPYGAIRPFIGAGYSAIWLNTRSDNISISSTYGPVIQIGVNFVAKNDTFFTIEAKQYFMDTRLKFERKLFDPATESIDSTKSTLKFNPLVISMGIGYKF